MDEEQAIQFANEVVFAKFGRHLSNLQVLILHGCWRAQTYERIAQQAAYTDSYIINDAGPKLWMLLSEALGEKVTKKNFRAALERSWLSLRHKSPTSEYLKLSSTVKLDSHHNHSDLDSEHKSIVVLTATIKESDRGKVEAILEHIRNFSIDASLTVKRIEKG